MRLSSLRAERKRLNSAKVSDQKSQIQEQLLSEISPLKSKVGLLECDLEQRENENEQMRNIVDELNRKNHLYSQELELGIEISLILKVVYVPF